MESVRIEDVALSEEEEKGRRENTLKLYLQPGESHEEAEARVSITPMVQAAETIRFVKNSGWDAIREPGISELAEHLEALVEKASSGDNSEIDAILISQARTLDLLFNHMIRRASMNFGEYPEAAEKYMKLALRAQANCRVTLECFSNIKKPVVKNIAHGPQQVNIHPPGDASRGESKNENPRNELITEKGNEQSLDREKQKETVRANPDMASVGKIQGSKIT